MAEAKTTKQVYVTVPIELHSKLVLIAKASQPPKPLKEIVLEALYEKVAPLAEIEDLDNVLAMIGGLSK